MSEEQSPERSWLERLSDVLVREPQDRQQLINLLRDSEARHLLDANALTMIEGVLQVSEMQVRDIMIPRAQMVMVEHDAEPQSFLPLIIESAHSRFPVAGENRDEVIGILLAKDLLKFTFGSEQNFHIEALLRPVVFVPESKRLNVLLQEFRLNRNHMAIVVDEYGGVAGLVTIEDVLEQIVGEIEDEYDVEEDTSIKQHEDGTYMVKAITPLDDFNSHFEVNMQSDEFDTIGGVVLHALGHLPKRGEEVSLSGLRFKVLHADNRRIRLLQVMRLEK